MSIRSAIHLDLLPFSIAPSAIVTESFSITSASMLCCIPGKRAKAIEWFAKAAFKGLLHANFRQWSIHFESDEKLRKDEDQIRKSVFTLQAIAMADQRNVIAQLKLCEYYARGYYGELQKQTAISHVHKLFSTSYNFDPANQAKHNSNITEELRQICISHISYKIKDQKYSDLLLHRIVKIFNKCLHYAIDDNFQRLTSSIARLTMRMNSNTQTWLLIEDHSTENAWHDVFCDLKMVEFVMGITKGDLEVVTILDYLNIILAWTQTSAKLYELSYHVSNLSLMFDELCTYPEASIAVSCYMVAHGLLIEYQQVENSTISEIQNHIYPKELMEFTGLSYSTVMPCFQALSRSCTIVSNMKCFENLLLNKMSKMFNREHLAQNCWKLSRFEEWFQKLHDDRAVDSVLKPSTTTPTRDTYSD